MSGYLLDFPAQGERGGQADATSDRHEHVLVLVAGRSCRARRGQQRAANAHVRLPLTVRARFARRTCLLKCVVCKSIRFALNSRRFNVRSVVGKHERRTGS